MKRANTFFLRIISVIFIIWILLTFFVELEGAKSHQTYGKNFNNLKAFIVYDPDPFYDLDKQICNTIALTLSENGWYSKVVTVAASKKLVDEPYDLYVFCTNTYNWAPDRVISNYLKEIEGLLSNKNAVAITLGGGSTKRAQRILEKLIRETGANLIASKSFWLLKPNDETRKKESNVIVANQKAQELAKEIISSLELKKN